MIPTKLSLSQGLISRSAAWILCCTAAFDTAGALGSEYSDLVISYGPVSYWRLGESSGTTAVDVMGAHNGTYQNSMTLGQAGGILGDSNTAVSAGNGADNTWRCEVYGMDAVTIDLQCDVPKEYMKIARELFAGTLVNMPSFKGAATGKKADEKIDYVGRVIYACKRALSSNAAVRYTRNKNSGEYADIYIQVIDCLSEAKLIRDIKTPPGNAPCESRLLPRGVLLEQAKKCRLPNPWRTNPKRMKYYVEVRDENKNAVPFDREHPTAVYSQRVLELSNFVNSLYRVWYPVASGEWQQLITEQYRIFRPGFDRHGRIYTRGISHQNIRREERLLIEFEMEGRERSIEYDYKNFFALISKGIFCRRSLDENPLNIQLFR